LFGYAFNKIPYFIEKVNEEHCIFQKTAVY
jgi:hypothetical protein